MYGLMITYDFVKPKKQWSLLIKKSENDEKITDDNNSKYIRSQIWTKNIEPFKTKKVTNNDPTFLGIKNSAQISVLNQQMNKQINDLIALKAVVKNLQITVNKNKNQIDDLGQNIEGQLNNI
jgi:hypothetical protein